MRLKLDLQGLEVGRISDVDGLGAGVFKIGQFSRTSYRNLSYGVVVPKYSSCCFLKGSKRV